MIYPAVLLLLSIACVAHLYCFIFIQQGVTSYANNNSCFIFKLMALLFIAL